jgi:hypothetical protein
VATRRLLPKNETTITGAVIASAIVLLLRGWILFGSGDNILAYANDPIASIPRFLREQFDLFVLSTIGYVLDVAVGLAVLGWTARLEHEGLISRKERILTICFGALPWTALLLALFLDTPPVAAMFFVGHAAWVGIAALIAHRARVAGLLVKGPWAKAGAPATLLLGIWLLGGAAAPWVYGAPPLDVAGLSDSERGVQLLKFVDSLRINGAIMIAGGAFTLVAVLPLMGSVRAATAVLDERLRQLREES